MSASRGFVAPGFEPAQEAFESLFERGWDTGASFSAYAAGKPVVQLTGGSVNPDTIQIVASATKVAEAACIALLVDRGLLRYGDRIAEHWPEFGAKGKEAVTVRQLMMHRAGIPTLDRKLGPTELLDLDARAAVLAEQAQDLSLFAPESADWRADAAPQAYHGVTRGLYSGELVRRVDPEHRSLGRFFREEIAEPLGIDFWIGLPESEQPRVVPTKADPAPYSIALSGAESDDPRYRFHPYEREFLRRLLTDPNSLQSRGLFCFEIPDVPPAELAQHRITFECELPSSNGVGNAEALARLMAMMAGGGELDGVRIFQHPETLREALACADRYEVDGFLVKPMPFTQGGFGRWEMPEGPCAYTYGWGGGGGQMARFAPDCGLGIAYVTPTLGARYAEHDPRPNLLLEATLRCLA